MFLVNLILFFFAIVFALLVLRFLSKTSLLHALRRWWRGLEDSCHVYQFYRVPQFNEYMQENQLYRRVSTYLNSLPCLEDSDFTNLFSGKNLDDISLVLDPNQIVADEFLGARIYWKNERSEGNCSRTLVLKIRRKDKQRILRPYLLHVHNVFDEIEQRRDRVKLFVNATNEPERIGNGRWRSAPFNHPATIDTVAMDSDLKNKVKSDLDLFLKSKQYYHRLGRVWKRSYLLHGPSGTGKSSFVAGMAKFLNYDIYDVDLSKVSDDSDLKLLLLQTTNKSMIVIEDLDRCLAQKPTPVSFSGILNFMDGIFSCCGEERVMVFTTNGRDQIDPAALRPGRIDVQIHFPLCDFSAFKSLASSHLGLKDHKLFPQLEEIFRTTSGLSPAEIGEIMISNRSSPSRALKSVITALRINGGDGMGSSGPSPGRGRTAEDLGESGLFFKEGGAQRVKELRTLYGLLKRSNRRESSDAENSPLRFEGLHRK